MNQFHKQLENLQNSPKKWLITGVAGFIGSNLLETLLKNKQRVVGLDNFITGHKHNLTAVQNSLPPELWNNFQFIEGDIRSLDTCHQACEGVDYVLHQAALGSVPRSLKMPEKTNEINVDGFLNMLIAARDARTQSFTYASSSSVYGDNEDLPKLEAKTGEVLSPYGLTKKVNELYAKQFEMHYNFPCIGLRYFNVFGKRQDPEGAYAAVIPRWVSSLLKNEVVEIFGDGETSRDFCYIENVIQINILAATATRPESRGQVYNAALNEKTSLNELYKMIAEGLKREGHIKSYQEAEYKDFRPGDIRHSQANIEKATTLLGYEPEYRIQQGLEATLNWYASQSK